MITPALEVIVATRSPGRLLRRINRTMLAVVEDRFMETDVSFTQWIVLKLVRDGVASQPGTLAREVDITTGAMTRVLDCLEERQFVRRTRVGHDRRVVNVLLTEAGDTALDSLTPTWFTLWSEVFEGFTDREVASLVGLLERLLASLDGLGAAGAVARRDTVGC